MPADRSAKDRNKQLQKLQKAPQPPKRHPRPGAKGHAPHSAMKGGGGSAKVDYADQR